MPYRAIFDLIYNGKRHVMMGPSQIDRFGNVNISAIGEFSRPRRPCSACGARRATPSTTRRATGCRGIRTRAFVHRVDMVSGVGYDRAAQAGEPLPATTSCAGWSATSASSTSPAPDHRMRLVSVHPGVTVDEVAAATGFELVMPDDVPPTREPTAEELG